MRRILLIWLSLGFLPSLLADWKADYQALLDKYAGFAGVDYESWHSNEGDMKRLRSVVEEIGEVETHDFDRAEKLAHYINAYNAWTLFFVLEKYPVKSIRDIGLLPNSVFRSKKAWVNGEKVSLDTIEKEFLLKDLDDPRIHFAVNCGSKGCPALSVKLYTAEEIELQLEEKAKAFIRDGGVRVDKRRKILYLSKIFEWYRKDFESDGALLDYINRYLEEPVSSDYKIRFEEYDWELNKHSLE